MIYISLINDPYFNLALENHLLLDIIKSPYERALLLYKNNPCVVIGRFQNPWIECNLQKMYSDNILLVRRQSGGGTVYHDLNNINFSFIAKKEFHDKNFNNEIILKVLENFNIPAKSTKRGDIRLLEQESRKVSGSASKEKKDSAFHHGTMLICSDLEKLNQYISSDKQSLVSKSIASIRSVVANITEVNSSITPESFIKKSALEFTSIYSPIYGEVDIQEIDEKHKLFSLVMESEYYQALKTFKWKFLETPKFDVSKELEFCNVSLSIKKCKIGAVEILFYNLHPSFSKDIGDEVYGESIFDVPTLLNAKLKKLDMSDDYHLKLAKFIDWFSNYFCLDCLP